MRARSKFTLETSHTLPITVVTPSKVERITVTYADAKSYTLTVKRVAQGDSNPSTEVTQPVSGEVSLVCAPPALIVKKGDQLVFTSTIADAAEVVVEYQANVD